MITKWQGVRVSRVCNKSCLLTPNFHRNSVRNVIVKRKEAPLSNNYDAFDCGMWFGMVTFVGQKGNPTAVSRVMKSTRDVAEA